MKKNGFVKENKVIPFFSDVSIEKIRGGRKPFWVAKKKGFLFIGSGTSADRAIAHLQRQCKKAKPPEPSIFREEEVDEMLATEGQIEQDNYGQYIIYTGMFLWDDGTVRSESDGRMEAGEEE